jgi:hypothetical protein
MNTLEFCSKCNLKNYTINPDDTIDVDDNCYLSGVIGVRKLPVKFGKVSGNFSCRYNKLTTLENCPKYIGGNFWCDILTHHILGNVQGKIHCRLRQRIVI